MRDAVNLKGQIINYEKANYQIEEFCLVPNSGQVYIRLKNILNSFYLNVPLSLLILTLQQQIKL